MSTTQDRIVSLALVLTESAWLAALLAVIGAALGAQASPVAWGAVFIILGASALVERGLQLVVMPMITARVLQMLAGVVVVYLTAAWQIDPALNTFDLNWINRFGGPEPHADFTLRAVFGGIGGVLLWMRGGQLGGADILSEALSSSFKFGLIALAIAVLVDLLHPADLNIFPLMFLFFAAGVTGMGVGQMLPPSAKAKERHTWPRVIGGVTAAVVLAGLLFSLLNRGVLAWIAAPLGWVLNGIATVLFWVIIIPIVYLLNLVVGFFFRLLLGDAEPQQPELNLVFDLGEQFQAMREGPPEQGPAAAFILQMLEWTVLAIIVAVALFLLARAFNRRARWRKKDDDALHDSVGDEADPLTDLGNLLWGLLPERFRRRSRHDRLRLPEDDPDIVDVFRIYFGMLTAAEDKGIARAAHTTPMEHQAALETVFPTELVRPATSAFVRACYGHQPASRDRIEAMRELLERSVKNPLPAQ